MQQGQSICYGVALGSTVQAKPNQVHFTSGCICVKNLPCSQSLFHLFLNNKPYFQFMMNACFISLSGGFEIAHSIVHKSFKQSSQTLVMNIEWLKLNEVSLQVIT